MKISMVSEHASPLALPGSVDAGGQNVHVRALARGLARRGHAVTVFTRRDDPELPERVWMDSGVDVVHLTAGPARHIPKDELLPLMPELSEGLARAWTADPPDVVHSHFWMSGIAMLDGVELLPWGVPRPATAHTYHALGSVKRRHQGDADTSPAERAWIEPLIGNEVDAIIATCPDEVLELQRLGIPETQISVVPCGVDVEEFSPQGEVAAREGGFRILSIGRLVPRKGVDLVVRALRLLADRGMRDVELVVAGTSGGDGASDPEIERLEDLARSLDLAPRVRFLGQIPREEVPPLIRSADVVVCTPWYEPFGIVPLESMACGVPVIVAAVGGLGDSVVHGETGFHVPPRDPDAIAAFLERLLPDEHRRKALGRAGRERAEQNYSWDRVVQLTEAAYERARLGTGARLSELAKVLR